MYGQSLAFALRICLSSSGTVGSSFFGLGLFSGFGSFVVDLGFGCSGSRTVGTGEFSVYAGGGQTVFVVARTVAQVSFEFVILVGEFHTLGKGGSAFKVRHRHFENGVLHTFYASTGLQSALEFGAFDFVHTEACSSRSAFSNVCRIDVPSCIGFTRKDDVDGGRINALVLHAKVDLCLYGIEHRYQHQE